MTEEVDGFASARPIFGERPANAETPLRCATVRTAMQRLKIVRADADIPLAFGDTCLDEYRGLRARCDRDLADRQVRMPTHPPEDAAAEPYISAA
ncbi:MAG: hypothetical protein ABW173_07360 [Sphingomonas sp.]